MNDNETIALSSNCCGNTECGNTECGNTECGNTECQNNVINFQESVETKKDERIGDLAELINNMNDAINHNAVLVNVLAKTNAGLSSLILNLLVGGLHYALGNKLIEVDVLQKVVDSYKVQ
jgi:hypothetical protein